MESSKGMIAGVTSSQRSAIGNVLLGGILLAALAATALRLTPTTTFALILLLSCIAVGGVLGARSQAVRHAVLSQPVSLRRLGIIAFLLLSAGAVRLYGFDFGTPHYYHPDEQTKVRVIRDMTRRDSLNPRYFRHPSLLLYSTYGVSRVLKHLGIDADNREMRIVHAGRIVSIVAGTLSVYLLFLIGSRLFSPGVGVTSALILAFSPLHITCSRYVKEDVLCTVFILGSFLAAIVAAQEKKLRYLYISAILAGLAAGSKYTGIAAAGIVLAIPWLMSGRWWPDLRSARHLLLALPLGVLTFLVTTPYALFSSGKFIRDFIYEKNHLMRGHPGAYLDAWSQSWMWHFTNSILPGITLPVAVLAIVGLGMFLARRSMVELLIVALVLVFYLPAEYGPSKPMPQPDRYVVPCLPFLALAAAECVRRFSSARLYLPLSLLLIAVPVTRSISLAAELPRDTRVLMADWIQQNIPRGSSITLIGSIAYLPRLSEEDFELSVVPATHAASKLTVDELRNRGRQYVVTNSFSSDRYYLRLDRPSMERARFDEYASRLILVKEIVAPSGSYGFHNPRLRLYSVPP